MSEWNQLEQLAARAAAGDDPAWSELMAGLHPRLVEMAGRQRIGRLRARRDDIDNIVVRVFEKLARERRKTLRKYFENQRRPSFSGWLAMVVRSCAVDYMRLHPEYRRPRGADADQVPSAERWVSLATLTTGAGVADPDTLADKRSQVLRDIRAAVARARTAGADALAREWRIQLIHARRLVKKGELYERVLVLTFQGHSQRDIADKLDLSRREVDMLLSYIRELLQARYGSAPT